MTQCPTHNQICEIFRCSDSRKALLEKLSDFSEKQNSGGMTMSNPARTSASGSISTATSNTISKASEEGSTPKISSFFQLTMALTRRKSEELGNIPTLNALQRQNLNQQNAREKNQNTREKIRRAMLAAAAKRQKEQEHQEDKDDDTTSVKLDDNKLSNALSRIAGGGTPLSLTLNLSPDVQQQNTLARHLTSPILNKLVDNKHLEKLASIKTINKVNSAITAKDSDIENEQPNSSAVQSDLPTAGRARAMTTETIEQLDSETVNDSTDTISKTSITDKTSSTSALPSVSDPQTRNAALKVIAAFRKKREEQNRSANEVEVRKPSMSFYDVIQRIRASKQQVSPQKSDDTIESKDDSNCITKDDDTEEDQETSAKMELATLSASERSRADTPVVTVTHPTPESTPEDTPDIGSPPSTTTATSSFVDTNRTFVSTTITTNKTAPTGTYNTTSVSARPQASVLDLIQKKVSEINNIEKLSTSENDQASSREINADIPIDHNNKIKDAYAFGKTFSTSANTTVSNQKATSKSTPETANVIRITDNQQNSQIIEISGQRYAIIPKQDGSPMLVPIQPPPDENTTRYENNTEDQVPTVDNSEKVKSNFLYSTAPVGSQTTGSMIYTTPSEATSAKNIENFGQIPANFMYSTIPITSQSSNSNGPASVINRLEGQPRINASISNQYMPSIPVISEQERMYYAAIQQRMSNPYSYMPQTAPTHSSNPGTMFPFTAIPPYGIPLGPLFYGRSDGQFTTGYDILSQVNDGLQSPHNKKLQTNKTDQMIVQDLEKEASELSSQNVDVKQDSNSLDKDLMRSERNQENGSDNKNSALSRFMQLDKNNHNDMGNIDGVQKQDSSLNQLQQEGIINRREERSDKKNDTKNSPNRNPNERTAVDIQPSEQRIVRDDGYHRKPHEKILEYDQIANKDPDQDNKVVLQSKRNKQAAGNSKLITSNIQGQDRTIKSDLRNQQKDLEMLRSKQKTPRLTTDYRTLGGNINSMSSVVSNRHKTTNTELIGSLPSKNIKDVISPVAPIYETDDSSSIEEREILTRLAHMIRQEFAYDGYLENGIEEMAMAEYVLSVAGMNRAAFKEAVADQYCDLYWDDELLNQMYSLIDQGGSSDIRSSNLKFERVLSPSNDNILSHKPILAASTSPVVKQNFPMFREVNIDRPNDNFDNLVHVTRKSPEDISASDSTITSTPSIKSTQSNKSRENTNDDDLDSSIENASSVSVLKRKLRKNSSIYMSKDDLHKDIQPILEYNRRIVDASKNRTLEELKKNIVQKLLDVNQQIKVEKLMKFKTLKYLSRLQDADEKQRVSPSKSKLARTKRNLEDMEKRIAFLITAKKQLEEVDAERWGLDSSLLYSLANCDGIQPLSFRVTPNNPLLVFGGSWDMISANLLSSSTGSTPVLQAGTRKGLLSFLYARDAKSQNYVNDFLLTFRYIATPLQIYDFITNVFNSATCVIETGGTQTLQQLQVQFRSLDILYEWIEGYYAKDFSSNEKLERSLIDFIENTVNPIDATGIGMRTLYLCNEKKHSTIDREQTENTILREQQLDEEEEEIEKTSPRGFGSVPSTWRMSVRRSNSTAMGMRELRCFDDVPSALSITAGGHGRELHNSILNFSATQVAKQLTLMQQELFLGTHPIDYLEIDSLDLNSSIKNFTRPGSTLNFRTSVSKHKNIDVGSFDYMAPERQSIREKTSLKNVVKLEPSEYLEILLERAQGLSVWIAAELCACPSAKIQLALLTEFIKIAKWCFENRNYATFLQIVEGLEMIVVRQLPVWRSLSVKSLNTMEELSAYKLRLQADILTIILDPTNATRPILPPVSLFLAAIQQHERDGFSMPNGMYKWSKMRIIAKIINQVRLFKVNPYTYPVNMKLQRVLSTRMVKFQDQDLQELVAQNQNNFPRSALQRSSQRLRKSLQRVKHTFQRSS